MKNRGTSGRDEKLTAIKIKIINENYGTLTAFISFIYS